MTDLEILDGLTEGQRELFDKHVGEAYSRGVESVPCFNWQGKHWFASVEHPPFHVEKPKPVPGEPVINVESISPRRVSLNGVLYGSTHGHVWRRMDTGERLAGFFDSNCRDGKEERLQEAIESASWLKQCERDRER